MVSDLGTVKFILQGLHLLVCGQISRLQVSKAFNLDSIFDFSNPLYELSPNFLNQVIKNRLIYLVGSLKSLNIKAQLVNNRLCTGLHTLELTGLNQLCQ